jgi:Peptidase family M28
VRRKALPLVLFVAACGGTTAIAASSSPSPTLASSRQGNGVVWPDEGALTWAPRPTEPAITANDLRTRLYQIADDSMEGRRIGEPGNYKTTAYIAREFERMGLKPGGPNGSYFQELPYGPAMFALDKSQLIAGSASLNPGTEWIPTAPAGVIAASANLSNAQAVFAGRWGDTTTALDGNAFNGKVAVFTAPLPAAGGRGGGRGGQGGGNFATVRDPRARAAGAVAVLVIALDSMSRTTIASVFAPRGMMQANATNSSPQALGGAAISGAAAAKIFGKPVGDLTVGTTGQPMSGHWTFEWSMSKTPARNVIAILPGSDPARATQYVLVGAHNDHVGVNSVAVDHDSLRAYNRVIRPQGANDPARTPTGSEQRRIDSMIAYARSIRPPKRDSTMNGADDDGSGTAVLLEIAEKFSTEKPARSIIFVSHQGEEAGLLGSRWFVDHPTIPLDSIVAAHNMDMLGKGRAADVKYGGPTSVQTLGSRRRSRQFGDIIDSVNAISAEPMAIDRSWDVPANPMNRFCRSDQVNYVRVGIPTTYFSLGYSIDYHQPTDEARYVDFDHSARLARFIHDIMTAVANRKDRPALADPDTTLPSCR